MIKAFMKQSQQFPSDFLNKNNIICIQVASSILLDLLDDYFG